MPRSHDVLQSRYCLVCQHPMWKRSFAKKGYAVEAANEEEAMWRAKGARRYKGLNMCSRCYNVCEYKARHTGRTMQEVLGIMATLKPVRPIMVDDGTETCRWFRDYILDRRRRGIPPEGTAMKGEYLETWKYDLPERLEA